MTEDQEEDEEEEREQPLSPVAAALVAAGLSVPDDISTLKEEQRAA